MSLYLLLSLTLLIRSTYGGHILFYVNNACTADIKSPSSGINELYIDGNTGCANMAGVRSVRGGFVLGPACTLNFYSQSNCQGAIAHTINTGATSGSCLSAPQSAGYLSMRASCSGSTEKRDDTSLGLSKRAGPDGIELFNDQRFWNIQQNPGHAQDFTDFLEIDSVLPQGDREIIDNTATDGALAESASREVMNDAMTTPNSHDADGNTPRSINGWNVVITITTQDFQDANGNTQEFTIGDLMFDIGVERFALIIIDSAVAARNFNRATIGFGIRYRSNGHVAAHVLITFLRAT